MTEATTEGAMNEGELRDYLKAKMPDVTLDTLMPFIQDALAKGNGYGQICVAIGAIAVAAARAADRSPNGGITGFQAGAIFWEFSRGWGVFGDGPKRMVTYADMCYPQYADKFALTITPDVWTHLQTLAAKNLTDSPNANPEVIAHWKSIVAGVVPFGHTVKED